MVSSIWSVLFPAWRWSHGKPGCDGRETGKKDTNNHGYYLNGYPLNGPEYLGNHGGASREPHGKKNGVENPYRFQEIVPRMTHYEQDLSEINPFPLMGH